MNEEYNKVPDISDEEMRMPQSTTPTMQAKPPASISGLIIGIMVLLLVLILGGIYLWSTHMGNTDAPSPLPTRPTDEENDEPESTTAEAEVDVIETVSISDEIDAIEADIEATNFDNVETEFADIEAELDAAFSN